MTYEELVKLAKESYCSADASAVKEHVAIQFNVTGEAEGAFYLEIKDGQVHVEPYEYYDRNAIIHINGTNFIKLINGKLDPVVAFTTGKIKVDGDINSALEMIKFIK